ncbi:MAG: undecaprenyl/decaprenyl-phosphate alpha-N-acetylglucosaminyl 1-phosphate transferase [bacterium]|nr:undecaprenyl/decaprenyl-phosphate alpha-N-acetylglucosaminyl 1-phosphate transferase [bacterium]
MELEIVALLGFAAAFLMSWLVQPHFRNLGFLTEIVDHPGYRRAHREPVPRTGGMAIFISFFCALFFLEHVILDTRLPWSWLGILSGAGLAILALGVGDDRFGIHAEKKLYGQLVVILALMLFGQRLDTVTMPLVGTVPLGGWAWPVTLLWYLGFINSMNLIDGLDGLASGISVLASAALVVISMAVQEMFSTLFAATVCGATMAFFYWNVSKRKIFLGDSGSMWMGLVLASLMLNLSQIAPIQLPVLLAPMIVPIWDTGTTIIRRYRRRTSIFQADDFHLHHRLLRLGFSPAGATLCLLLVTTGTTLFALSDFLDAAWLGLPAMGMWMVAAQLGAQRHLRNRQHGLDLFSELSYALGLDDRLDKLTGRIEQDVADIIDLQAERQRVARLRAGRRDGTTGAVAETEDAPVVVRPRSGDHY